MDLHIDKVKHHGPIRHTPVDEAIKQILSHLTLPDLPTEFVDLSEAHDRVLANDVTSLNDFPPFDKASMDGYAVVSSDTNGTSHENPIFLNVIQNIFAGEESSSSITSGNAIAISTGSMIPSGADAVMMLEKVQSIGNRIKITEKIDHGENIAKMGEEVKKNQIILGKGTWIKAHDIGLLASIGVLNVPVFKKPKVAVIATGNELIEPGGKLGNGQIFESNRYVVSSLIQEYGGKVIDMGICRDEKEIITNKLKKAMECDMIVVTGGSSVGEKDYVPEIINTMGKPGIIVHGIAMKPGSPAALGLVNDIPILVTPGFPVSSYFSFYTFGRMFLQRILQTKGKPIPQLTSKMLKDVKTNEMMRTFVRVNIIKQDDTFFADPTSTGDSRLLSTLTNSDGFIIVENKQTLKKNEQVQVILLRNIQ